MYFDNSYNFDDDYYNYVNTNVNISRSLFIILYLIYCFVGMVVILQKYQEKIKIRVDSMIEIMVDNARQGCYDGNYLRGMFLVIAFTKYLA